MTSDSITTEDWVGFGTNPFMRTCFLALLCLILGAGCGVANKTIQIKSDNSSSDSQKDRPIIYCWFVEDNGAGHSGYAIMDTYVGRPLLPGEHLYSSLAEVQQVAKSRSANPIIMPQRPGWVPEHWKVRDLSAKEQEQLRRLTNEEK